MVGKGIYTQLLFLLKVSFLLPSTTAISAVFVHGNSLTVWTLPISRRRTQRHCYFWYETCCSHHGVVLSTNRDAPTFHYSGSSDGVINFWEKEKVSFRYNHGGFLQGHRFGVLCLTVVELLLLSGSKDTTVRIWRREEGGWSHECLVVLDGHRGPVKCLAGTLETMENRVMNKMETSVLVYSGSSDKTFKVWRVKVFLNHNDQDKKGLMEYEEKEAEEEDGDLKMKKLYETSSVLFPSWVQMKLQPNYF